MSALEHLVLAYTLNAAWQVPALVLSCAALARVVRNTRPPDLHRVWLFCAGLAVLLPVSEILGLFREDESAASAQPIVVSNLLWQIALIAFGSACLIRTWKVTTAALEAHRLSERGVNAADLSMAYGAEIRYSPPEYECYGPCSAASAVPSSCFQDGLQIAPGC